MSSVIYSIAIYIGKKKVDKKLADDLAKSNEKNKAKSEADAKKSAADAVMANADAAKDQETLQSQFKKMLNKAMSELRKDLTANFNREIDKLADDFNKKLKSYPKNRCGGRAAQIDHRHRHARSTSSSRSDRYDKKRSHRNHSRDHRHVAHHHHRRSNSRQRRSGDSSQSRDSSRSSRRSHSPRRSSSTRRSTPSSSNRQRQLPWFAPQEDKDSRSQSPRNAAASLLPQRGRGRGRGMIPRGGARGGGQGGRGQPRRSASRSPNTRDKTDEERSQDNERPWHHQQNRGRGGACRRGSSPHRR